MVAVNEANAAELEALIRSQARDDASDRVRHRGRVITGIDLDTLPDRGGLHLIDGPAHVWRGEAERELPSRVLGNHRPAAFCPNCKGSPGWAVCLFCGGDQTGLFWRGKPVVETGGPTTYDPDRRYKGGVGG